MVKFGGKIGTLYQMLKNAFKKHPLQNRTNVQIKGGGVKGLLNNVQKNCTFLKGGLPLVIQLFSRRLCVCHRLCIRICLCICVPNSVLNSYYHKLSENVWVWGLGEVEVEIWSDVTMAGRQPTKQGKIGLLSQWTMEG